MVMAMGWATALGWMGVPQVEMRVVEGTKCSVRTRNNRTIQGERRRETVAMEVISRKASTENILGKLLYADDLAVVAGIDAGGMEG